jgi:hypothetical protein
MKVVRLDFQLRIQIAHDPLRHQLMGDDAFCAVGGTYGARSAILCSRQSRQKHEERRKLVDVVYRLNLRAASPIWLPVPCLVSKAEGFLLLDHQ